MHARRSLPLFAALLLALLPPTLFAQPPGRGGMPPQRGATLVGQVLDGELDRPIQYATFILFTRSDSTQVTGTTTGEDGWFSLPGVPPGRYYAEVSFLGYTTETLDSVAVERGTRRMDLGDIVLHQAALEMEGVDYVVERSPVEYQIDRKVVRVDKQATSASGTAVDVLENVPSVSVDIEGNVSLRGSGNFRVLIDGRPTVLDANDALQQTPAGAIENIEIITNPSAKYDPEGTAGIINIVLKKERRDGHSGRLNLNTGYPLRYGADGLYQRKYDGLTFVLGADVRYRSMPGTREAYTRTTRGGVTTITDSEGEMLRQRLGWGLRGSMEMELTPRDWVMLGVRGGSHGGGHESDLDYLELVLDSAGDTLSGPTAFTSETDRSRGEIYGTAFFEYRRTFPGRDGHELAARLQGSWERDDEETTDKLRTAGGAIASGRSSTEEGPSSDYDARLDYTLPLGKISRFEAGYRYQRDLSGEETGLQVYEPAQNDFVPRPRFDNTTDYDRSIHALYTMYADEWGPLGAQLGLRGEYTDRRMELTRNDSSFTIDRADLFPSLHLSWDLGGRAQAMGSYSRRIDRPRGWYLEPFLTWMDAYNVRRGNPELEPEYIDSYEVGYQLPLGPFHHSTEVYYRMTHDLVERFSQAYPDSAGVTLHTLANVGTGHALGTEVMFNGDLTSSLNANLMGNFYQRRIDVASGEDQEDFSWSSRLALTWKLTPTVKLQGSGIYNSPEVSSQGRRKAFYMVNAALEGAFYDRALTVILQARDLFNTARYSRITEGQDLYSEFYFDRTGPFLGLTLRWNFNHYRESRRERGDGNGNGLGGEDDFM